MAHSVTDRFIYRLILFIQPTFPEHLPLYWILNIGGELERRGPALRELTRQACHQTPPTTHILSAFFIYKKLPRWGTHSPQEVLVSGRVYPNRSLSRDFCHFSDHSSGLWLQWEFVFYMRFKSACSNSSFLSSGPGQSSEVRVALGTCWSRQECRWTNQSWLGHGFTSLLLSQAGFGRDLFEPLQTSIQIRAQT